MDGVLQNDIDFVSGASDICVLSSLPKRMASSFSTGKFSVFED